MKVLGITVRTALYGALSLVAFLALFAGEALAQNAATLPASTGTVMAAAMETAGYKAQELVLTQLHETLGHIGVLIFIVCAVGGVFSIVFTGGYRMGMWLIVAPSLFFFTIDNRVTAPGVDWQFGAYTNQNGAVTETLGMTNPSQAESDVAWVFHRWNQIVSSMIQETVKVITWNQTNRQMKFMTRQKIMEDLFAAEPQEGGLWSLVRWSTAMCHQELSDARMIALGERDKSWRNTPEYRDAYNRVREGPPFTPGSGSLDKEDKPLHEHTLGATTYVETMMNRLNSMSNRQAYMTAFGLGCLDDSGASDFIDGTKNIHRDNVSCKQLWCFQGVGLRMEALGTLTKSMDKHMQFEDAAEQQAVYSEILREIALKLQTCELEQVEEPPGSGKYVGKYPDHCRIDQERGEVLGQVTPDESIIPTIMAGYMLRKIMTSDQRSQGLTTFAEHAGISGQQFNFNFQMTPEQRQKVTARMKQHQLAVTKQAEIYVISMTLPYLQGALLYGLALLFPFFALLLIIPGKAGAFFKWMALWFWVKSWDLGWAFVMVIDDVLWDLMPNHSKYDPLVDPNHGPISIFEQAFNGDPAYNLGFYYMLIGMLLTSIPMLSAQLVLGSKQAMFGMLMNGLKDMSDQLSKAVGDMAAIQQVHQLDYMREARMSDYVKSRVRKEQMATKAAEEARRQQEKKKKRGFWARVGGAALAVAGVAALAVATVATGGVALLVVGGAVAIGAGAAIHTAGLNNQRQANAAMAGLNGASAQLHYYHAGQQDSTMMLDELRAGASDRGEYWNMPEAPAGALAYIEQMGGGAQAGETENYARATGSSARLVASGFMKGQ